MSADKIIDIFCESKGITRELLFGMNKTFKVRSARHMLYCILRDKCGMSSYKLAAMFNRTRRNVVRGISTIQNHIALYKDIREEYESILTKVEGAINNTAPSEDDME